MQNQAKFAGLRAPSAARAPETPVCLIRPSAQAACPGSVEGLCRAARKGFTLIEVLVSLAIVSAALFPVLSNFRTAVGKGKVTQAYGRAVDLMEERLNTLKNAPFKNLSEAFFPDSRLHSSGAGDLDSRLCIEPRNLGSDYPEAIRITPEEAAQSSLKASPGEIVLEPAAAGVDSILSLETQRHGRAIFDFRLRARKFTPTYKYWGAQGKKASHTGFTKVRSSRPMILFQLEVFWKVPGEGGREGRVEACYLRSPTS